jgi:hypothetical protein
MTRTLVSSLAFYRPGSAKRRADRIVGRSQA